MNAKTFLGNFLWAQWPDSFKPTDVPDRYTLRINGTRKTWAPSVDKRAMKEARKFGEPNGYRDAKIVKCDRNRLLSTFDYTIDFIR